jgi:hypothetical protein
MLALTLEGAKNSATVGTIVLIVVAVVVLRVVHAVVAKVIATLMLVLLAGVLWSQRSAVETCANEVRDKATRGDQTATPCSFLGLDVEISLPMALS